MTLNPVRLWRRRRRLKRDALDEAQHLRRRHGDQALAIAQAKLADAQTTTWGRAVLRESIKLLRGRV